MEPNPNQVVNQPAPTSTSIPLVNPENKPKKSHKALFFLLGILIVLVLLGGIAGGYFLGKNNSSGNVTYAPTPTPSQDMRGSDDLIPGEPKRNDETADWKTYTNKEFTIKYPEANLIEDSKACNYVKANNLKLFKINAEGKYLCGSEEPYYFYINSVDKKDIVNNSCYIVKKENIKIDNITAEKYTTTFKNSDKSCTEQGIGPISKETISIYINHNGKLYLIYWPVLGIKESIFEQMLNTFSFTN